MNPQERALQLIEKFKPFAHAHYSESTGFDSKSLNDSAKQCVLVCIEEMIKQFRLGYPTQSLNSVRHDIQSDGIRIYINNNIKFLEEIKSEINKL